MISNLSLIFRKNTVFSRSNRLLFNTKLCHLKIVNLSKNRSIMLLSTVIQQINKIAPKKLAEKWDNTGLLVDPFDNLMVSTIFFTNDLTESVLEEAIATNANMIISYHPPIFSSIKSLSSQQWKDRIVMKCIQNNIAIYSPHTACDAVDGGVNDWLLSCFDIKEKKPITQSPGETSIVQCFTQNNLDLTEILSSFADFKVLQRSCFQNKIHYEILVEKDIVKLVHQCLSSSSDVLAVSIQECKKLDHHFLSGMGRIGKLEKPSTLKSCIEIIKSHLKLTHIRVAIAANTIDSEIHTIAVCAGSGASLLKDVPADLYITGEMSHHDMLDCTHKNTSVILCEHSNSERGYLEHFAQKLQSSLKDVKMVISKNDRDPVCIL